jgi:8-oxo-dGTP diphosphatase
MVVQRLRVAAYGVCVRDGSMLLARYVSQDRTVRHWTLPGGRVEHGEDPIDAVVREVAEETGYQCRVDLLLGVESRAHRVEWGGPDGSDLHRLCVYYRITVIGGDLRDEIDGSTDQARWIPRAEVETLARAVSVDVGLAMDERRPADGHVPPIPVEGLLRH